ncbi:MAG TPA: vWA domain-containing protein, partial [Kofleriaceae bacterium]|nr:vWA domain-containing protein [Kofleriaceae bacterium]
AKAELASRIDGISAGGDTALYDATKLAYDLLAKRRSASAHRIRAAVVMTDGVDNKSHLSLATLSRQIGGEDRAATTFTIGYGPQANPTVLGNIASAGAGSFSKGDVSSIIQVYKDLGAFF